MRAHVKLADDYAEATECNLATLEVLLLRKRSSDSDRRRQRAICFRMLQVCKAHEENITWRQFPKAFPRVREMLDGAKQEPMGLEGALDRWILEVRP